MTEELNLVRPKLVPPLDEGFSPAVLAERAFQRDVADSGRGVPLVLAIEREDESISRYETSVYPEDHPRAVANLQYAERIFKFLLWQRGGWKAYVGGSEAVADYIRSTYTAGRAREFDYRFVEKVYNRSLEVVNCAPSDVPRARESGSPLGRHLDGCRIGFDLGASDIKVAGMIDGEPVFSEEIIWEPSIQEDPSYHYRRITSALRKAAAKLPRVDAIGGSAAGVYVNNQVRVASLFRSVPKERYDEVRNLFLRIRDEMGAPLVIVNDGEVAALAGSMSLNKNGVLGIALGSSEAAGYVNTEGNITGWLNELAFAPIDYSPDAPIDEWSGDRGCGVSYLSQQGVFRLARKAGMELPRDVTNAERLKFVQGKLAAREARAVKIWQSIGIYAGYAIAHYADFYALRHVLLLGRVTSGEGGELILEEATKVFESEFPELAEQISIHLPDEKSRRVGQAVAAASLPMIS
jgi:predicted NBD/HSP70 family sugar kinase